MEHTRAPHPVHLAHMNTWAPFHPSYLSADQDHVFGDAVFASVMDGAKCGTATCFTCGFNIALTYFGLSQQSVGVFWSFPRKTECKPPCINDSTCDCTICLKKANTT